MFERLFTPNLSVKVAYKKMLILIERFLQTFPALDPDEVGFEPRSSRLLVRGLGENDMDEDEEDCESSARLLGMSFMNRSSANRSSSSPYMRQGPPR